jgi:hypothetical protein
MDGLRSVIPLKEELSALDGWALEPDLSIYLKSAGAG